MYLLKKQEQKLKILFILQLFLHFISEKTLFFSKNSFLSFSMCKKISF